MKIGIVRIIEGDVLAVFCPGCGTHHGMDKRWTFNGNYARPTFSPSINVTTPGHRCHSFIENGIIRYLSDCDHKLAGQTVDLVKYEIDNNKDEED